MIPMKDFFAQAGGDQTPDLVILDPGSVTLEQLQKMAPILEPLVDKVVLYGKSDDKTVSQALAGDFRRLPLVFSRSDLETG